MKNTGEFSPPLTWREVTLTSLSKCGIPSYLVLMSSMSQQKKTKITVSIDEKQVLILYTFKSQNIDISGLLKKCLWRGKPLSCASIFKMQPTDQGMCCSFNKQKAEEMYVEGRYQEHVIKMTEQDAKQARAGSTLPEW